MKVHWTEHAITRLKLIETHIAEDSPEIGKAVSFGLLTESRKLAELPFYGRVVPEYKQDSIREILKRPYRIIYRLNNEQIDVLTVMHYRQLLPADLNSLIQH